MSWLNNILGHIAPQNQKETEKKGILKKMEPTLWLIRSFYIVMIFSWQLKMSNPEFSLLCSQNK